MKQIGAKIHIILFQSVMASPPSPSAGCFAHVATKQTDTTSKCTIPFGHPPQPETTRIAETHCITSKRHLDRPNGTWDPQGDALSIHKFSRIHHELAINIHFPFFAPSFSIQHSALQNKRRNPRPRPPFYILHS